MIIVKGYGQMCNNILQYAHMYALGREHGIPVISTRFAYKYRYFPLCHKQYHNFFVYLFSKLLISTKIIKCFTDENHPEDFEQQFCHTRLIASYMWIESRWPELFLKYREEIKALFEISEKTKQLVKRKMNRPENGIALGLHIRRGDYATHLGGKFFFSDAQYIQIIRDFAALHIHQTVKPITVYICTNDPKLDLDRYKKESGVDIRMLRGNRIEDLTNLSLCDYIIGAQSSFSLWAAFYHDLPIYWINPADGTLTEDMFKRFADYFCLV